MSGFEDYVRSITRDLDLPPAAKERVCREALAHLEDDSARLIAEGKDAGEAERFALERFGDTEAIRRLMDQALAGTQNRRRYLRILYGWFVAAAGIAAAFLIGLECLPVANALEGNLLSTDAACLIASIVLIAFFGVLALQYSKARWYVTIPCAFAVFGVYALALLGALALARTQPGQIIVSWRVSSSAWERTASATLAWLVAYFAPAFLVSVFALLIYRGRRQTKGLAVFAAAVGVFTGILWVQPATGGSIFGRWSENVIAGASAVFFLLLTKLLADSIHSRFVSPRPPASAAPA